MKKIATITIVLCLVLVGMLSGCVRTHSMELSVIVIDDNPPDEYEDDYESISGKPATIGVYLCRQDERFEWLYHFKCIDNISLSRSEGIKYEGSKTVRWTDEGTLCVGYSCHWIDGISMAEPRDGNVTIHHWRYIGQLPVG